MFNLDGMFCFRVLFQDNDLAFFYTFGLNVTLTRFRSLIGHRSLPHRTACCLALHYAPPRRVFPGGVCKLFGQKNGRQIHLAILLVGLVSFGHFLAASLAMFGLWRTIPCWCVALIASTSPFNDDCIDSSPSSHGASLVPVVSTTSTSAIRP